MEKYDDQDYDFGLTILILFSWFFLLGLFEFFDECLKFMKMKKRWRKEDEEMWKKLGVGSAL